ncbi:FHA domain-containing protein [Phytomonospora sp. NPDC050363]|uniref:FHA domain-containing protein n=1 Tax=Phytomonospora sp. NPDC050363 TaxID=3155642 RepID=UPI0033DCAF90
MVKDFLPQVLSPSTRRLADGVPSAPPGTIFALADAGGYAVPLRKFTLHFGRGRDDVHVPIGVNDPSVSRLHGVLSCDGSEWWIRNTGRLPIEIPGAPMLLSGHEALISPGYTPMLIASRRRPSHLLEIHVVGSGPTDSSEDPHVETRPPDVYDLSLVERMVVTALAQRYLRQEPHPQPVSWRQVADDLNRLPDGRTWTPKSAEHKVGGVRERLASGRDPIPGILREEVGEPVGNVLNHNLIQALLRTATLIPEDLALLGDEI